MATGELVAAMAGSVLEMGIEEPHIARLRGLPWNYGIKDVCEFLSNVNVNLQPAAVTIAARTRPAVPNQPACQTFSLGHSI